MTQRVMIGRHFGGWIGTGRGWTPWIQKRVIPAKASALGYQSSVPDLDSALHDLLGQQEGARGAR